MGKRTRNRLLALLAIGLVAWLLWSLLLFPALHPIPSLPNPNGYTNFLAAGQIANMTGEDRKSTSESEWRAIAARNVEALKLVSEGLRHESRVTLGYTTDFASTHMENLASFKRLAWALRAEGGLAEAEERSPDAARIYLETMRFGQESVRGGLLISRLVGVACTAIGLTSLEKLASGLAAPTCRESIRTLEDLEARREPLEEVLKTEKAWSMRTYGFRLADRLTWMLQTKSLDPIKASTTKMVEKENGLALRTRQLMIALAARACELERGQPPKSFADLVPGYLKTIPQDPFTGTNLVYNP